MALMVLVARRLALRRAARSRRSAAGAAARPAGRAVLGHRQRADAAGRDLRLASCSRAASNSGSPTRRADSARKRRARRPEPMRASIATGSTCESATMGGDVVDAHQSLRHSTSPLSATALLARSIDRNLTEAAILRVDARTARSDARARSISTTGRSNALSRRRCSAAMRSRRDRASHRRRRPGRGRGPARSGRRELYLYARARVNRRRIAQIAARRRAPPATIATLEPLARRCSSASTPSCSLVSLLIVALVDLDRARRSPTGSCARSASWSTPRGG